MTRTVLFALALGIVLTACDAGDERPLTFAERLAGSWNLVEVKDGPLRVDRAFEQAAGTLRLDLQSVGCCAGSAGYRLTVTRLDGPVETRSTYLANDTPTDGDDFIQLEVPGDPAVLVLGYDFNASYTEVTLSGLGDVAAQNEYLAALEIDFTFRDRIVFVFEKAR